MLPVLNPAVFPSASSALRAAVWRRLSTEEQNSLGRAGLDRQREQTDRLVAARGYQVVATFEVIDVSGTSVEHSPEFAQLRAMVESGRVQVVCVSEFSRICRPDSMESLAVLGMFARHGCLLVADGQEINFADPQGFLTGGLQALLAGHERMTMLRKINAAKEANRRKGLLTGSHKTLPLGVSYDKAMHRFFYNEQIHRVVEAFRLMDEDHLSLCEIGRRIGIHANATRGVLENEIYIGWRVYDEKRDQSVKLIREGGRQGGRPKIARAPDEVIRVQVIDPPAVSPECFARVQAALKEVRLNYGVSHAKRHPNLCTVIGRCGFCSEPLYVTASGKRRKSGDKAYGYYCCKSRYPVYAGKLPKCSNGWVRRQDLDDLLIAFCQDKLNDPVVLVAMIEASARRTAEIVHAFPAAKKDETLAKLRQRDRRLVEMCEAETISIDEFRARRAKLREEIDRLERIVEPTPSTAGIPLKEFARLVTRAAVRFSRIKDRGGMKSILTGMFSEVFFRHESITAFRFSKKFLADLGADAGLAGETVQLATPFRIREPVPEGHKRCSCCGRYRPAEDYYKRRAQCRECYRERSGRRATPVRVDLAQ